MSKQPKSGIPRLFQLAENHRGLLIASGVLAALAAAASFVPYVAIYFIIRDLIGVYPDLSRLDVAAQLGYGAMAVAGVALDAAFFFASSILAHIAAFRTQYELKAAFARHLARVPLGYHITVGSGRFRKVMDQDIEKIEQFLAHSYPDMVASYTAPLALLVLLFAFDWRFGIAAFAAVLLALAIQMMSMGTAGPEVMANMQRTGADMTAASVEYVRGMPVLKAFGQTAQSFRQLADSVAAYTKVTLGFTLKCENYISAFRTIINNIYLAILPVGISIGRNAEDYETFLNSFLFYLLFTPAIAAVLNKFMYVSSSSMRIAGGVANYDAMMALPELPEAGKDETPLGTAVEFRDVSFSYEEGGAMALSHVSFTAPEGKLTAIVGPSGGGKSTIAHLIPRFWDVTEGSVAIGGADVRSMPEEVLMEQVGFVFQDVYLFGQSIRENIRMGRPRATDREVEEAARAAMCEEFIRRLPDGYETVLGGDGVRLSGGEAQRLSIARAILKAAPILVLDEATAFADPENERMIQAALARLMAGKTVIAIAHRLGTVKNADQILVMSQGRLAEAGTHRELVEKGGLYAHMWERYTQSLSWDIGKRGEMAHENP